MLVGGRMHLFSLDWNYNLNAPVIVGIRSDMPDHLRTLKVGTVIMRVFKVHPSCGASVEPSWGSAQDFLDELSALYASSIWHKEYVVMLDVAEIFTEGF